MNTIDITAIILGILTLLGGCGWFVSGRRHKQKIENLKADNARKYLDLVAELAETIGVKICVEGIENKDQLDKLDGMKIKYIQGYYFDKPLVRQEFEKKYVLKSKGN